MGRCAIYIEDKKEFGEAITIASEGEGEVTFQKDVEGHTIIYITQKTREKIEKAGISYKNPQFAGMNENEYALFCRISDTDHEGMALNDVFSAPAGAHVPSKKTLRKLVEMGKLKEIEENGEIRYLAVKQSCQR